MSIVRKAGTTDVSVVIRIVDSTDGTPETGVTAATGGLVLEYRRELAASVSLATIVDLAALTTAHTDKGIIHIGNGYYRLDLVDAACAAGATGVAIHGVATGMVVIGEYVQLVAYDPFDAVRLGLTALPNAAADAAGGLPISDTGGLDLDAKIGALTFTVANVLDANALRVGGTVQTARDIGASVLLSSGTGTGQLDFTSGVVKSNLAQILGSAITGTASQLVAAFTKFFNVATPTGTVNSLPDAVPGAAGGVFIAGSNAATTFSSLTVTNATTLSGAVSLGSTLTVTGAITATNASNNLTLGTFTVTTNLIAWNAAWDAEVQSEATDALNAYDPPTNAEIEARTLVAADYATNSDLDALIATVGVAGAGLTEAGGDGDHLTAINLPDQSMNITGNITGNLSGSVGSVTGAVGSVTGNVGGNVVGSVASVTMKTGYKLASDGLDLVVPADPSAIPVLGTSSIVVWIGYFGAWTVNEVQSDADEVRLRNSADNADLATHAHSDDATTFQSNEPT